MSQQLKRRAEETTKGYNYKKRKSEQVNAKVVSPEGIIAFICKGLNILKSLTRLLISPNIASQARVYSQSADIAMPVTGKITKKSKREKKASIFSPNTPLPPSIAKYIDMNSHLKGVDHGRLNPTVRTRSFRIFTFYGPCFRFMMIVQTIREG